MDILHSYIGPDVTGQDPHYRKDIDITSVYTPNQKYNLTIPAFKDTIVITKVSVLAEELVEGIDWNINADDIDQTSIARIKAADPSFDRVLVKSITFTIPSSELLTPIRVNVDRQQLYPVESRAAIEGGVDAVELTPSVVYDLLTRLSIVETAMAPTTHTSSVFEDNPPLLAVDIVGNNPDNDITNESHIVQIFQGKNKIYPKFGSFYLNSMEIYCPDRSYTLVPGVDYQAYGLNHTKTKLSEDPNGIYDYVKVVYPFNGELIISYHAFGGEVTRADASIINRKVDNLIAYFTGKTFITNDILKTTPAYLRHEDKISQLEATVRALLPGSQTFGDRTNGSVSVHRLQATNTQRHWWTIAELYKVEGDTTNTIITTDRFKMRLKTIGSNLMADVSIAIDTSTINPVINIESSSVIHDLKYVPFVSSNLSSEVLVPQFRIVYSLGSGTHSGTYLQIGLALPALEDTIAIQDESGSQSSWKLLPSVATPILPKDNAFLLPDQSTVWDFGVSDSKQAVVTLPEPKPYCVWEGSTDLSTVTSSSNPTLFQHVLPSYFRPEDIKDISVILTSNASTPPIVATAPLTTTSNKDIFHAHLPTNVNGTLVYVKFIITKTPDSFTVHLFPDSTQVVAANVLNIRYILAKV